MFFSFAAATKTAGALALLTGCSCSLTLISAAVAFVLIVISAIIAYEVLSRPPPLFNASIDVNQQSEPVPGMPNVRRRRYIDGRLPSLGYVMPSTTYDVFSHGLRVSNNGDCLGWRADPAKSSKFTWLSYKEVRQRSHNFGSGLVQTGLLVPGKDAYLGIYAKNSVEWVIAGQACGAYSIIIVPLYDTLGKQAIEYIINQARLTVMLVDNEANVNNLLATNGGALKMIVCVKPLQPDSVAATQCKERGIKLVSYAELEETGAQKPAEPVPAKPDDLYIICYTSGTTGDPKGVMITHKAVTTNVQLCLEAFLPRIVRPQESVISYLPLAHMYEHLVHLFTFVNGCKLGLFGGNILNIKQDLQALRPVMMPMVPRIMNRIYQTTISSVQGNILAKTMLRVALYFKVREVKMGYYRRNSIWDFLVFRRIQNALGGQISVLVVGSAPISGKVLNFTRAALGVPVFEGYGQTESGGAASCAVPQDNEPGQVGPPIGQVYIKLIDVPELDYSVDRDGVGEILIQAPIVMRGYFRDAERTRETIDADKWLHTGDIGRWTERGALQIVDRKKHLFKLAQGEYVAPEKIENILLQCKAVTAIFVDGDPLETYAVAVVSPNMEHVKWWAAQPNNKAISSSYGDTLTDAELNRLCVESVPLRNYIAEELVKYGKRNGLSSFEIPKRILLVPDAFTVENGLLTPTMKLKRPDVRKKYKATLHDLYKDQQDSEPAAAAR